MGSLDPATRREKPSHVNQMGEPDGFRLRPHTPKEPVTLGTAFSATHHAGEVEFGHTGARDSK